MAILFQRRADTAEAYLTAEELATETGALLDRCYRVLPAVLAMVEDYSPYAPVALKREATLRAAGYLLDSDYGAIQSESVGPLDKTYHTGHQNFFRRSGAAAILTRHRRRIAATVREA